MTENVSEIAEALKQRDTRDMALWFADIAADGTEREERKQAMEFLGKLAEYKPLAKIEEMEEQNYNMVDNVLNNGAGEKAQKEENKKASDKPAAKPSLKARLAEKKEQVAGQSRTEVIKDISRALKHLEEDALIELSGKVLEKLNGMSDEEFARINLTAAE